MTRSSRNRLAVLLAACACVLALSRPARSQSSGTDKAAAEALFEQGKALMQEGQLEKACAKLDASQRLDPAVGTLLFLGDCYEKRGKKASAWATFREASSLAERRGDERQKIADVRATALRPQVSYLEVNVTSPSDSLVVRRGGAEIPRGSWGSKLPLDAGRYTIEASAPGKQPWSQSIDVKDGGLTFSIDVPALRDDVAAPQPTTAPPPDEPTVEKDAGVSPLIVAGSVIGGVGVVALVIGGVFGLLANDSNQQSLEQCPRAPNLCNEEGVRLRDEAKDRATVSTALFAVGGVLTGGGLVLIILGATQNGDEKAAAPRWQLASRVGPGQAELVVRGRF